MLKEDTSSLHISLQKLKHSKAERWPGLKKDAHLLHTRAASEEVLQAKASEVSCRHKVTVMNGTKYLMFLGSRKPFLEACGLNLPLQLS
jgi:hypothetical protein